ncbi:MAG: LPS export ABC transporter permease LptG [Deltaproteobacteria bacterium]|nr:LPS export ABC transporter permease LptG [Deltaproteobacteria bacterium]
MTILRKYILLEFVKVFLLTTLSLVTLFLLVDIVEKGDELLEHGVPLKVAVSFFLFKVPAIICQISPISVLLSVLLSLGLLNRHGEISAIKASGISITTALAPLFLAGIVITLVIIFISETAAPPANRIVENIEGKWLTKTKVEHFGRDGLWGRSSEVFYNIRRMNLEEETISGITIYELSEDKEKPSGLKRKIRAREAEWKDNEWITAEAFITDFTEGKRFREKKVKDYVFKSLRDSESILSAKRHYEQMDFTELRGFIRGLEKDGYDTSRYRVELYSKLSFPFVNFIMVLIAIPFALRSGRNTGLGPGVVISVSIGFSYWIIFGMTKSLGTSGIIPPIIAATFPDVLYLAVGLLMYGYVKQ